MYLYSKPSAAAITDYFVKTPLTFADSSGQLAAARLHVQVNLEVATDHHRQQQQQKQLAVTVDLCDSGGTVLLQDLSTKVEQVRWGSRARTCVFGGGGHFMSLGHIFSWCSCRGTCSNRGHI